MNGYVPVSRVEKVAPVARIDYSLVDSNGEVVREVSRVVKRKNRKGFIMVYTDKMVEFLSRCRQGATVRLLVYIASKQGYGLEGVFGFRTTRKHLSEFLGIDAKTVYTALKYLEEQFIVNELRIDGALEFMVNPDYVSIGSDRKARDREWSARWEFYWKHLKDRKRI